MKLVNRKNIERLIIILVACVAVLPFAGRPLRPEYALINFRFAINRGAGSEDALRDVAVVLIDTESEARLGRPMDSAWREFYPDLLATLDDAGARAVIWDVTFASSEPEFDPALAVALESGVPVVAGEDSSTSTTDALRDSFAHIGWLPFVGTDSIPRRIPAMEDPAPLSWIASRYLVGSPGEIGTPLEEERWIDYSADVTKVATFSMADVLLSDGERLANEVRTPLSIFTDRVVFLGLDLPATDRYALPGTGGSRIPGVYSQMAASLTLAGDRAIVRPGFAGSLLIGAAVAIALTLALTLAQRLPRRIFVVVVLVVGLLGPIVLFSAWRIWVAYMAILAALAVPLVGVGITRRMTLTRSYRTSLGFDPELLQRHEQMIAGYSGGVEREAVVLCADVRNYTQFVTDHKADQVQQVMSEYLEAMESIIDTYGGYVNKYVGDEVVAVFGFPRNEKGVVDRAVKAALAMLEKLTVLQKKWLGEGLPALEAVGVGLDSGPVRFTNLGGRNRVQFDVIGNPINGASRLQTLTKEHKRSLILPAEMVEEQQELEVAMYGAPPVETGVPTVAFIGEVMIRGQGRRRVYGLV